MKYSTPLSFEEAKTIAANAAKQSMRSWLSNEIEVISDEYIQGERFWIFFRNPDINLPEEAWSQRGNAYIVSESGFEGTIGDLRNDPETLNIAINGLSQRFAARAERDGVGGSLQHEPRRGVPF
jgi:hypothetical protein